MPVVSNSINWRSGSVSVAIGIGSSRPVVPGSRGSSFGGGTIVTDWRQRGHNTLNGSVGSRSSSNVKLIAHCGQLAIMSLRSDRKSTRLNSSHVSISYAVFCLKKKNENTHNTLLKH